MGYGRVSCQTWLLLFAISLGLLLNGCGEQKPKVYRVGILCGMDSFVGVADSFRKRMQDLGYVEGKNIVYDFRQLNADPEGEKRVARKFVADKVDLILAFPTEPALAAKEAAHGTPIPVVFCNAMIERTGLVESVRQPGGNITGVRFPGPELLSKRFEILLELVPGLKRLYIPYDPHYPNNPFALEIMRTMASSRGVILVEAPATRVDEIRANLEALERSGDGTIDAIQIMPEALTQSPESWGVITEYAAAHKVPIAGAAPFTARKGALFSLAPDLTELGRLAAPLADKVFKRVPAGTIPVATPEAHLRLNYALAQALGLKIPRAC